MKSNLTGYKKRFHDYRHMSDKWFIRLEDESLLFVMVYGSGENIKEKDNIVMIRNGSAARYFVHSIQYSSNLKYTASLIFIKWESHG